MKTPEFYIAVYEDGSIRKFTDLQKEIMEMVDNKISVSSKLKPFYDLYFLGTTARSTTKQRALFLYGAAMLYNESLSSNIDSLTKSQACNAMKAIRLKATEDVCIFFNITNGTVRDKMTRDLNILAKDLDSMLIEFFSKESSELKDDFVKLMLDNTFDADITLFKKCVEHINDYVYFKK